MLDALTSFIQDQQRKRIETASMERHLQDTYGADLYWQKGGYEAFTEVVRMLEGEGILRPIKSTGWNGNNPPLYNVYQHKVVKEKPDTKMKEKLLTFYHPQIQTSYYLLHPEDYTSDEWYMERINTFLKQDEDNFPDGKLTVQERSFQLFQDEKWLASSHGRTLLQRIGLTWEDLGCFPTYEPFFYFHRGSASSKSSRNVLIVENKDTFFSLKSLFKTGVYTWDGISFDLLIYGEGHKIEHSFVFFWELEEYQGVVSQFYYFGDLDPEGIAIWHQLAQKHKVEIQPFVHFYQTLVRLYGKQAPLRVKKQRCPAEALKSFISYFPAEERDELEKILERDRYIPQEGLHGLLLRQLSLPAGQNG